MATLSRKGYWRMSRNKIVHQCLNNRWLKEQGVPEMRLLRRDSGSSKYEASPQIPTEEG